MSAAYSEDNREETSLMRRPLRRSLVGLIFLSMLFMVFMAATTWPQAPESIGRITALEGQATVLRQGRFRAEPLALHTPLFEEDIIETAMASKLRITLTDTTVISLGER